MKSTETRDIKQGNLRAYYQVFEQYHPKLYRYVYRYTQSAYYADETVQISFVKLWEKREDLSDEYSISTQLFRIAKSTLIDLLRKEKLRRTLELSDHLISTVSEERIFQHREELKQLLASIEDLPLRSRQVFKMSRIDHLSHKEISAQLSISPKTIETHISKALKYLRKSLSFFL